MCETAIGNYIARPDKNKEVADGTGTADINTETKRWGYFSHMSILNNENIT